MWGDDDEDVDDEDEDDNEDEEVDDMDEEEEDPNGDYGISHFGLESKRKVRQVCFPYIGQQRIRQV